MADQFVTEIDLPAAAEEVFQHLTDPAAMIRWMGQHATLQPVPGGAFEVDINGVPIRGQYLEIDPPRRVLVSWGVAGSAELPPGTTEVEFTLTPIPAGTRLRLVHRNLPSGQDQVHAVGWSHFLARLIRAAAGDHPGPDPWNQNPVQLRSAGAPDRHMVGGVDKENVSATLSVAVPAAKVFAVLADPTTHGSVDGRSRVTNGIGRIQDPVDRAPLTVVGQVFRMEMYHPDHPDGTYRTANKVHVLDPPRAIGWLTGTENDDGTLEFGGWFWRYDLAPLGPSECEVTLTYDWSAVPPRIREYIHFPPFGPEHLANSLRHLAELAAPTSA